MARRALQQDVNTSRDLPSEDPCDHDGLSLYNLYDIRNMYLFLYKFVYFSVYAPCVYWCPQKPEKASGYRELELQVAVNCQMWVQGTKQRFLQKQQGLLTTESFLQPEIQLLREC